MKVCTYSRITNWNFFLIEFIADFNDNIQNLPSSVISLKFIGDFQSKINLPPSLTHLTFWKRYKLPLPTFPSTLNLLEQKCLKCFILMGTRARGSARRSFLYAVGWKNEANSRNRCFYSAVWGISFVGLLAQVGWLGPLSATS